MVAGGAAAPGDAPPPAVGEGEGEAAGEGAPDAGVSVVAPSLPPHAARTSRMHATADAPAGTGDVQVWRDPE